MEDGRLHGGGVGAHAPGDPEVRGVAIVTRGIQRAAQCFSIGPLHAVDKARAEIDGGKGAFVELRRRRLAALGGETHPHAFLDAFRHGGLGGEAALRHARPCGHLLGRRRVLNLLLQRRRPSLHRGHLLGELPGARRLLLEAEFLRGFSVETKPLLVFRREGVEGELFHAAPGLDDQSVRVHPRDGSFEFGAIGEREIFGEDHQRQQGQSEAEGFHGG